jgi:CubicO group peptidase (beta-lactamase class C family)
MSTLVQVKPEEVGFSSARLSTVNKLIHHYLKIGLLPGAVAVIARKGKIVHFNAYGKMDFEQDKLMREETLFRLFSMTQPLIAMALLTLYEQGYFQLTDPVAYFIPAFKELKVLEGSTLVTPRRAITIHDLLTHRAGFSHPIQQLSPLASMYRSSLLSSAQSGEDLKGFIQKLAEFPLAFHPGEKWHYSLSYNVVAYLIEFFSGIRLDEFIAKKINAPLGLLDTSFQVPKHKANRLAVLYTHHERKPGDISSNFQLKRLQVGEDLLAPPTFFSGNEGLVSTATDYLRFCQMLLNRGELDGNRLLSRKSVELMTSQNLPADLAHCSLEPSAEKIFTGIGYGLGVNVMLDPAQAQVLGTRGSYFLGARACSSFFVDPHEELIGVFLAQVDTSTQFYPFPHNFRVATYQALL